MTPGHEANSTTSREDLMAGLARDLRRLVHLAERRTGHAVDKSALARRMCVSRNSVYAYLDGRRLPSVAVLDVMLRELGASADERLKLGGARDAIADLRHRDSELIDSGPTGPELTGPEHTEPADSAAPAEHSPPAYRSVQEPTPAASRPPTQDPAPEAGPEPPLDRRRLSNRARWLILTGTVVVLVVGLGLAGWSFWGRPTPTVVIHKGVSAVGRPGTHHPCTDPSCAYVNIRLEHFKPHHTYLATCKSTGGMDPLENRSGFASRRISTDHKGNGTLAGSASCLWGYQATQLWVTVESIDGIPPINSNRVDW